jgi:hypothetical protein
MEYPSKAEESGLRRIRQYCQDRLDSISNARSGSFDEGVELTLADVIHRVNWDLHAIALSRHI